MRANTTVTLNNIRVTVDPANLVLIGKYARIHIDYSYDLVDPNEPKLFNRKMHMARLESFLVLQNHDGSALLTLRPGIDIRPYLSLQQIDLLEEGLPTP